MNDIDYPEISIVVPFYNVLDYVPSCLDSLINQKCDIPYEIICIDDGSTDGTGDFLEDYAVSPKIRLFHKRNGGLSDARNYGVAKSRGKYLTFVDGDDVVSPFYLDLLYSSMDNEDNRIVIGGFQSCSFEEDVLGGNLIWDQNIKSRILARDEAFMLLAYDVIQPSACAKLAPRRYYLEHPFPLHVRYEEIRTVCDFFSEADSFTLLSGDIYGYVMRDGSITWSRTASAQQLEEYKDAIETICAGIISNCPDLTVETDYQRALLCTRAHSQLPNDARTVNRIRLLDDALLSDLKRVLPRVLKDSNAPFMSKVRFLLLAHLRPLYDALFKVYRTKVKKVG